MQPHALIMSDDADDDAAGDDVAVDDSPATIRAASYVLVTALWHHARFGSWPTTQQMSRMKSWSYPGRSEGLKYVRELEYLVRERDSEGHIVHRVSREGLLFVTAPDMELTEPEGLVPLPEEEDELKVCLWIYNFKIRTGNWPTPWHYQQSAVYRDSPVAFHATIEMLVSLGRLVRVEIRRGRRKVTRVIDTIYCPAYKGMEGRMFFWSTSQGPFPEP